jgi:hypothetical protein
LFFIKLPLKESICSVQFEQCDLASTAEELMRQHWVWAVGLAAGLASGAALAEDVILEPVYFSDRDGCLETLAEFNWFCVIYEGPMWAKLYAENYGADTYWGLTEASPTPSYRHDIDGDGADDMIVAINFGFCDRGGPSVCGHFFLFGDQPPRDGAPAYDISAKGRPFLTSRNGTSGLMFEGNLGWFHPISEIKSRTVAAHTMKMEAP